MTEKIFRSNGQLNGQPAVVKPTSTVQVNPDFILAVGTTACLQIRAERQRDIGEYGSISSHKRYLGIDTTCQADLGLPPLAPAEFINLSLATRMLITLLSWALSVPRVFAWLSTSVAGAAIGDGAGAIPGIARFLLEQSLPHLSKRVGEILDAFRLSHRGNLAVQANSHSSLLRHHATLAPSGKINITLVASTTGGTVGILHYVVLLLKSRLKDLSIDANFTLVLTLPACETDNLNSLRKRELCFGRLSELLDYGCGRTLEWHADEELVFSGRGPFFDCVFVMPEPSAGKLPIHNLRVGQFLSILHSAHIGTAIRQTAVDMLSLFTDEGPHGQPKLLTRIGLSEICATAFPEPEDFAALQLGLAATVSKTDDAFRTAIAEETFARHGLKPEGLNRFLPALDPPAVAPQVIDKMNALLVANERKKRQADSRNPISESKRNFKSALHRLKDETLGTVKQNTLGASTTSEGRILSRENLKNGPMAAADLGKEVCRRAHILRLAIEDKLGQSPPDSAIGNLQDQFDAVVAHARHGAHTQILDFASSELDDFIAESNKVIERYERVAEAVTALHTRFVVEARRYESQYAHPHALLDVESLRNEIEALAPKCIEEVRAALDEAVYKGNDPLQLQTAIQAIIKRHASPFGKLADFDEALRLAGERAEIVIANALAAAEPNARLIPSLDVSKECVQRLFATLPNDHVLLDVLNRSGRDVTAVRPPSSTSSVALISLDFGLEPAAFLAAREAVQAHVSRARGQFPPFADKRFEPENELVIPPQHLWHAYLALTLHWHLGTKVVVQDGDGRWKYSDISIGNTFAEAMANLIAEEGRNPHLPCLQDLGEEVRRLLGSGKEAIELLDSLEGSMRNQLKRLRERGDETSPDPKWLFFLRQSRGITRLLAGKLRAAHRDVEVMQQSRGLGRLLTKMDRDGEEDQNNGNRIGRI